jgi:hypothetical protein
MTVNSALEKLSAIFIAYWIVYFLIIEFGNIWH